jgi:hypothetical protein
MLTRESILSQTNLPTESVTIPEWGGDVFVKTMSGTDRDAFEGTHLAARKSGGETTANIRARLAVFTVCDASGALLFKPEDADALGKTHAKALDRVFDVARKLNAIGAEEEKELEGN